MAEAKCEMEKENITAVPIDQPITPDIMVFTPTFKTDGQSGLPLLVRFDIRSLRDWKKYIIYTTDENLTPITTRTVYSFEDALLEMMERVESAKVDSRLQFGSAEAGREEFTTEIEACGGGKGVFGVTPWYTFHEDDAPVRYLLVLWMKNYNGRPLFSTHMQGYRKETQMALFYGHYDMELDDALRDFSERWNKEIRFNSALPRPNLLDNPENRAKFASEM